jgi:hypothetical protein
MAFHAGSNFLDRSWLHLPRDFWIAADANGIVAEDKLLENVYDYLNRQGIRLNTVTIVFVPDGIVQ